jgi:AcrR family transcriptional regulator
MARVSAERREDYLRGRRTLVLDAAVKVFGRAGYERASMSAIAAEAGVSKGTLYNYFASKQEIFAAILNERTAVLERVLNHEQLPPREALRTVAETFLTETMDRHPDMARLILVESPRFPDLARLVYSKFLMIGEEVIARYLEQQAALGRMRHKADASIAAFSFFGMLIVYLFAQEILGGKEINAIDRHRFTETIVDMFLSGVARPMAGEGLT